MPVTIKIFTKQAGRPTLFQTRDFDALPVTIGRDATCSLVLEDPLKHISRVHVALAEETTFRGLLQSGWSPRAATMNREMSP